MKIFALDTATEACSVALWLDGETVERFEIAGRDHTQRLPAMAKALMADAGLAWSQLDGLVCGIGPGSFAGVRIGVAYTQGLALAHGQPVVGVSSLAMLAAGAGGTGVRSRCHASRARRASCAARAAPPAAPPAAPAELRRGGVVGGREANEDISSGPHSASELRDKGDGLDDDKGESRPPSRSYITRTPGPLPHDIRTHTARSRNLRPTHSSRRRATRATHESSS